MPEIPLFPLHTVLFPKIPLRLKIFEPRYQEMLGDCINNMQPFGVLLIKQGFEVGDGPVRTFQVGVTAQITHIAPQKQGVSHITAVGIERFKVSSVMHDKAYLVGIIEISPLNFPEQTPMNVSYVTLRRDLYKYLELIHHFSRRKKPFNQPQLPSNIDSLAYLASSILQIPPHEKQALLELENGTTFLEEVRRLLRREISIFSSIKPGGTRKGIGKRN